jgi:lipopolysaccharide export system protein LptA
MKNLVTIVAFAVLAGPCNLALAERADKDKPAIIDAAHVEGDLNTHTAVFTGDAMLVKGTIVFHADQMTVRQDAVGYTVGTGIATQAGKSTSFRQKREGVDEQFEGRARKVEYNEKADTTELIDHAVVRWLKAGREANELRGDRVVYNSRTEHYIADSDASSSDVHGHAGQTRTILQPRIRAAATSSDEALGQAPVLVPASALSQRPE